MTHARSGLAFYATLFGFAGYTPFYYLPYYLLPGIKLTRAAGMIFYLVSFSGAVLAGMGVQTLLAPPRKGWTPLTWWALVAGLMAILAAGGVWRRVMELLAQPERFAALSQNYPTFQLDTIRVLVIALLLIALCRWERSSWRNAALVLLVLGDLWSVERHYIKWSPPAAQTFAADQVVNRLRSDSTHFRVLPVGIYYDTYLMIHGLRSVLGYHGNELQRYDELLGGNNVWHNLGMPNLWRLLAVKYVVAPDSFQAPGLSFLEGPLAAHGGRPAYLYRVDRAAPFAYLVREAVRVPEDQQVPTLMDPRLDPRRLLLVPVDAPAGVSTISAVPDSLPGRVSVEEPRAGAFRFGLETPPASPAYLYVAENYFQDWRATVDGRPAAVLRAQHSLMAVPLPAGARMVTLEFASPWSRLGKGCSAAAALVLLALAGSARVGTRRRALV